MVDVNTTSHDFEIVGEAEDGRAAVKSVETLSPDLLLMDLSMPRMTGMEAITEKKKEIPPQRLLF